MKGRRHGMAFDGLLVKLEGGWVMERSEEKRGDDRLSCRSPVAWAYFNKSEMHSGQMRNFSSRGACFECTQAPVNGATILVRLETYPTECRSGCEGVSDCPWPPSIVLGDVKWCRDLASSGPQRFGVGLKFHVPV
jgi:hypothetical protein